MTYRQWTGSDRSIPAVLVAAMLVLSSAPTPPAAAQSSADPAALAERNSDGDSPQNRAAQDAAIQGTAIQNPATQTPESQNFGSDSEAPQGDGPLLDLDALGPASLSGLPLDLRAETLQGLPAGMAAMILGGGEAGQITLVPLALPVLIPASGAAGSEAAAESRAALALVVEVDGPSLFGPSPAPETEVQFFAYAVTPDQQVAGFLAQRVSMDLTAIGEAAFAGGFKLVGHLELPPGQYDLRILVHEPSAQRFGLSVLPVSIPSAPSLLTPLVEESPEAPWLMVGEAPHGAMGALDLGRVLELAGTGMPSALPLVRGREALFDVLVYGPGTGTGAPADEVIAAFEGSSAPAEAVPARVVSQETTGLPGLHRMRVGVPLESVPSGSYRLRLRRAADGATSPPLPLVVLQQADTANLWTDIERRRSGATAISVDMSEVNRRRRGRQRRARAAVADAYRQVLGQLATGDRDTALASLNQVEREVLESGQESPMALLTEAQNLVLGALAEESPHALLPAMMLHGRAYDGYLENLELGLSTHSRVTAISILELYARSAEERWGGRGGGGAHDEQEIDAARRIASEALASFGAYLQSAQVRMGGRALLRRALEINPENSYALLHLAAGLEKMGEYPEAVAVLRDLIALDPKAPEGRLRLGVNLRRLDRPQQATEILRGLVRENNPSWVLTIAYQELANLLLAAGQTGEAVTLLDQASGRLPDEGRLRILLAYALDRVGDSARSRQVVALMEPESSRGPRVTLVDGGDPAGAAPPVNEAHGDDQPALLAAALGQSLDEGASPRHRYNRWPRAELTGGGSSLAQAAMARLPMLGAALATLPGAEALEDRSRENR